MSLLKNKPKRLFYFLFILFAVPIIFAWVAFQHPSYWIAHTTNRGILLKPMKAVSKWPLIVSSTHQAFDFHTIHQKWLMLYVSSTTCERRCQVALHNMRQTQTATGKYQDQIARAYVGINAPLKPSLQKAYPDMLELQMQPKESIKPGLFLVDPQGWIILYYSDQNNDEDLYHDLMHLLQLNT